MDEPELVTDVRTLGALARSWCPQNKDNIGFGHFHS